MNNEEDQNILKIINSSKIIRYEVTIKKNFNV